MTNVCLAVNLSMSHVHTIAHLAEIPLSNAIVKRNLTENDYLEIK